jgi:hypothetical protein
MEDQMAKSKQVDAVATHEITISGSRFVVPAPYRAGHICTEGEAHALNQTLAENCRNNLAGRSKNGNLTQADVDEYLASHQFGQRNGFVADPIESMALAIARKKVNKRGLSASEVTAAAHELLASDKGAAIRKAATLMVEA